MLDFQIENKVIGLLSLFVAGIIVHSILNIVATVFLKHHLLFYF